MAAPPQATTVTAIMITRDGTAHPPLTETLSVACAGMNARDLQTVTCGTSDSGEQGITGLDLGLVVPIDTSLVRSPLWGAVHIGCLLR